MTTGKAVELICEFKEKQIITIDGVEVLNISNSNPMVATPISLNLFGRSVASGANSSPTWCRIGETQMWDNDSLVRDFIPVSSPKGNCMFDRVSEKLFCNEGTGEFLTN